MKEALLLDCTLRDGAYLIDKTFGDPVIRGMIRGLSRAHLDLIEIGFLQDEGFGEGKTVFKNAADAARFIPAEKNGTLYTVLADYSRFSVENLDENPGNSIDVVRECFFRHELEGAIEVCKEIKKKGYKVFVQPVDIMGYSDEELLHLLHLCNELEPECLSIVDTFGSMYEEDLQRVFSLIDHNLSQSIRMGFHSHNNLQMSNALSQAFLRMAKGRRRVVVDGTVAGMGRGAGNTPTELVAQYMVSKMGATYDIDAILDVIDSYMDNIRSRCTWGYSTPYFLAGAYSAHVNNVNYLTRKNSIRSRDIRYILNQMGAGVRKRYPYDLVEKLYMEYMESDIDDSAAMEKLKGQISGRHVVLIAPGRTATDCADAISRYVEENDAVTISVNFLHDTIPCDLVYMSNRKRYEYWQNDERFAAQKKILTSNLCTAEEVGEGNAVVSFTKLVKCGWENLDNSSLMLLRLLDSLEPASIAVAGLDGYSYDRNGERNYAAPYLELSNVKEDPAGLNREISEMLHDYAATRRSRCPLRFITPSRFEEIWERSE